MRANSDSPALVRDDIVDALAARMAGRFQGVPTERTAGRSPVARPDEDGVRGVAEMESSCVLSSLQSTSA